MCKWPICCPEVVGGKGGVAILLLRLIAGAAFIQHGWPMMQHPFGWMGPDAAMPGLLQALAAFAEFGGGIALILGLLTQLAALGITCVMLTAIFMVHLPHGDPFIGPRSYELAAVYLVIMIVFLLRGAGQFSLDALLFGKKK